MIENGVISRAAAVFVKCFDDCIANNNIIVRADRTEFVIDCLEYDILTTFENAIEVLSAIYSATDEYSAFVVDHASNQVKSGNHPYTTSLIHKVSEPDD